MNMDNINVVIRMRPLLSSETSKHTVHWATEKSSIWQIDDRFKSANAVYNFNRVYGLNTDTETVFNEVASPILDAVMEGYNGSIFAYGQTASGKTHTMMGNDRNPGLIPRTIKSIFDRIENTPNRGYLLRVSYIEIYNERVYDLLSDKRVALNIREDSDGQPFVENLKQEIVNSMADIMKFMRIGEKNRTICATAMNLNSSRSHAIFSIVVESGMLEQQEDDSRKVIDSSSGDADLMISHLNLVDLAGSEKTGQMMNANGSSFREGVAINTSLLTLRNVILKLSQRDAGSFINYRDSKLTRILQSSLGGNSKTSIICTVNPSMIDETHSTLKFADIAKCCVNAPVRNVVISEAALLKQYSNEITKLQKELQMRNKASFDQEQMKQQLEETNLRNRELEEKISQMRENVITSSDVYGAKQRARRETWGGFNGFGPLSGIPSAQSFLQSISERDLCMSATSLRTCESRFSAESLSSLATSKSVGCQVDFTKQKEKKYDYKMRVLTIQAQYDKANFTEAEREREEQMKFLFDENKVFESENNELKEVVEMLKKKLKGLEKDMNKSFKLTPVKLNLDCTELNESLGLIAEVYDQKLLPWSESEILDKLANMENEILVYKNRAIDAENDVGRLEIANSNYRKQMDKRIEEMACDKEELKSIVLKLKDELDNILEKNKADNQLLRDKTFMSDSE